MAFHSTEVGVFTKQGFVKGMLENSIDSLEALKECLFKFRNVVDNVFDPRFKDVYRFTFNWAKETPDRRYIEKEMAIQFWRLLLNKFITLKPNLKITEWIAFLEKEKGDLKVISKDVWYTYFDFLMFLEKHNGSVEAYDEDGGAWPLVLDDFVEYLEQSK